MPHVRPVSPEDFAEIQALDLTYDTHRCLSIERSGSTPAHTFTFRWVQRRGSPPAVYARPESDWLTSALARAELFLVAEAGRSVVGYLIALTPDAREGPTDDLAVEITDLAADRKARRSGAGRALVAAAVDWARRRSCRSLWVEPRSDNAAAIDFYISLGFRLAGFNDRLYSNRDHEPWRTTLFMHLDLR